MVESLFKNDSYIIRAASVDQAQYYFYKILSLKISVYDELP